MPRVHSFWEEEPNYARQKKEINVDPWILQTLVDIPEPDLEEELRLRVKRQRRLILIWKVAQRVLQDKPLKLKVLYLKFYVGLSEPKIAKQIGKTQPWVRTIILSAVNIVRKRFKLPPLKKIVENPRMARDKSAFRKNDNSNLPV